MHHSGTKQPSHNTAVLSYLTFWRSVFNFLISLVLVNLEEIVDFNTVGRKSPKCSDLRGLLFREEEEAEAEAVAACRTEAATLTLTLTLRSG